MAKSLRSIAEALRKAHNRLTEDLDRLEQVLGCPSPENQAEIAYDLAKARRYLTEHFRLEEQNGYMNVVSNRQPRFERAIERLHDEHRELSLSLDALVAEAEIGKPLDDAFRGKVQQWIDRLRSHETKEDELVQEAFTVDIGTKD
jgi:hypothetical protein